MLRASIILKVEQDGKSLSEREFSQEDAKLEDLQDMFLNTIFQRMQSLGADVFDTADTKLEELEAAAKAAAEKKKKPAKKKPLPGKKPPAKSKGGVDDAAEPGADDKAPTSPENV
jgi:hypothetical protein